ncbi:hypothetical protein [Rhizobium sp. SL42]|uniref:hypothetical protein n=1 Tax=Rhizobium sp. SL42 TaxID=2806346 RepID=UPI001F30D671|nr:hypothetical protein [Rhizobium sp. SL42]UJW76410.1 hypothetical protein IM739_08010 [Rhizobium sp. SL42]
MLRLLRPDLARNAYALELDAQLPRVLALADRDSLSSTRGLGDRQYWGWKLIDFANGTLQGGVNGLSALLKAEAFGPSIDPSAVRNLVSTMMDATVRLMRKDGSFEEALPYEQSYCVTALVLYDHLQALSRLYPDAGTQAARLAPACRFLVTRDETHGMISNHLATAVAALLRFHALTGDRSALAKAELLLTRILDRQSDEGWFEEYGGADPGYQTLCMSHLADAAILIDSTRLWNALAKATEFISHFAHPDGSFGGIYGSRATRIYYPVAMERLAARFNRAAVIRDFMRNSIRRHATVTLSAIDQPNLLPVFNNYAEALCEDATADNSEVLSPVVPGRVVMPQAGLLVDIGPRHHSIISTRKAVVYHWSDAPCPLIDTGVALADSGGNVFTSQSDPDPCISIDGDQVIITGHLARRVMPLPNPFNFLVLRILATTLMRVPSLGALVKKIIARLLVGTRRRSVLRFRRVITLGETLTISDEHDGGLQRLPCLGTFSVIHMASSGYWQVGDTAGEQK